MIRANAHVAAMAPYALAQLTAPPGYSLLSLSQNESFRPPSPDALKAGADTMARSALYPDPGWTDLRAGLAALHGLDADCILCGTGSLDLIAALARVYAGPDRAILAPRHAYPFFRSAAEMAGARYDTAPERDWTVDIDALLETLRPDTGIVFIANPGNPTGTRVPRSELERLHRGLPDNVLLVIDEAYGEFCDDMDAPSWSFVDAGNCVVLRTFSKAYGLAGLRVGWGVFPPDLARELGKVLNPNGIASVSQAAALAALEDQDYMRATCGTTAKLRAQCVTTLRGAGFRAVSSHTNFVMIDCGEAVQAEKLCAHLSARGIILRRQQGAGAPQAVRMTIGAEEHMARVLAQLAAWKEGGSL